MRPIKESTVDTSNVYQDAASTVDTSSHRAANPRDILLHMESNQGRQVGEEIVFDYRGISRWNVIYCEARGDKFISLVRPHPEFAKMNRAQRRAQKTREKKKRIMGAIAAVLALTASQASAENLSFGVDFAPAEGTVTFTSSKGGTILALGANGDIFVHGKLINNDKQVTEAMREIISDQKQFCLKEKMLHDRR